MILEEQKYSLAKKQSILLLPRLHHHSPPTYSPHSTFTEPCMRHTAQVLPGLQRWETKKFWGEGYNSCRPLGFIKRYPLHVLLWHESHTCSLCPASLLSWPPQAILGIPWHLPDTQVWRTRLQITPTLNSETDITSHSSQGTVLFSAGQNTVSQQKKHKDLGAGLQLSNLLAILEPAQSLQQGHMPNIFLHEQKQYGPLKAVIGLLDCRSKRKCIAFLHSLFTKR